MPSWRAGYGHGGLVRQASGDVHARTCAASAPITYHMYAVREWRGEPSIINDEHTELRWFTFEEAKALPDLALEEDYRQLFDSLRLADI